MEEVSAVEILLLTVYDGGEDEADDIKVVTEVADDDTAEWKEAETDRVVVVIWDAALTGEVAVAVLP